ncbi:MAG: hypothetical protein R3F39_09605 [Myxococcota bacterium]
MSGGGLQVARPTAPRPPASAPAPRATPARLRATALLSLAAALSACSASSPASDTTPGPDATPDTGITLLDVTPGPDATDADTTPQPDTPTACPNQCAKEYPVVPTCMATSWDIKTCSCSLRPAADGTACDDGVECTAADTCVAGNCEGGPPAELVEPAGGWQPEGTPLLQPDDPAWIWAAVHRDPSCRACDGSRAYLNWLASGSHANSPFWAAAAPTGELITLELTSRIRTYDSTLEPVWDAPGSATAGNTTTRAIRVGADGTLYATGWKDPGSGAQSYSWAARYSEEGDISAWERQMRKLFAATDVLPAPDLGSYLVEGGPKSAAGPLSSEISLSVRRQDASGNDVWATEIDAVLPLANSPFRLAPVREGGVVVAYMALETQISSDGTKSAERWAASAARFDADGAIRWKTPLGLPEFSSHMGRIAVLPDDHFMVFGVQWPTFGPWDRYPVSAWRVDADGNSSGETKVYPRLGHYFWRARRRRHPTAEC